MLTKKFVIFLAFKLSGIWKMRHFEIDILAWKWEVVGVKIHAFCRANQRKLRLGKGEKCISPLKEEGSPGNPIVILISSVYSES